MLLAIDTATRSIGLALHSGEELLAEHVWLTKGYHTVELAPEIALMLRRADRQISEITAIAVAKGPGSYTGLRIGMALGKGLCLVHNLKMVAIPTFQIIAHAQPRRKEKLVAVIVAGRRRIAVLWYKWGSRGWDSKGNPENTTWDELVASLDEKTFICGEIEPGVRKKLEEEDLTILSSPTQSVRRPGVLAELGWARIHAGAIDDPANLAPIYLQPQGSISS
jgi:tRNA threonylcarbamoyladenosine biosynthesis protein TsaB